MAAEMPALYRAKPTRLGDMRVGDALYFTTTAMQMDAAHRCWLSPDAMGQSLVLFGQFMHLLLIKRRDDGYAVTIHPGLGGIPRWDVGHMQAIYTIPVVEFTEKEATDGEERGPETAL